MRTRDLDRLDTEPGPGNRSAELNGHSHVVQRSDSRSRSVGKAPQWIRPIPQACRVVRTQLLKCPSGILRVAVGVKGESCGLKGAEHTRPVLQRLSLVGAGPTHWRSIVPGPTANVGNQTAERYQQRRRT